MTLANELFRIRDFLQSKVSPLISLWRPAADNRIDGSYQVQNPAVHIGWVPMADPEQPPPELASAAFPCIIVGLDDTTLNTSDPSTIGFRLSFAVYRPGDKLDVDVDPALNTQGYLDLVNLMDLTIRELFVNHYPGLDRDGVKCGLYPQQPYPFWYGWLTFTVSTAPQNYRQVAGEQSNTQVQNLLKG